MCFISREVFIQNTLILFISHKDIKHRCARSKIKNKSNLIFLQTQFYIVIIRQMNFLAYVRISFSFCYNKNCLSILYIFKLDLINTVLVPAKFSVIQLFPITLCYDGKTTCSSIYCYIDYSERNSFSSCLNSNAITAVYSNFIFLL